MKHYDVIVIGTGAGTTILETALLQGKSCAVIEKGKFGGTCLNRGCTPTKVLATVADHMRDIEKNHILGITSENTKVDWNKISENVWNKINYNKELLSYFDNYDNCDIYQGEGSFLSNNKLRIIFNDDNSEEIITGEKIFINTGGSTKVPDIEGLEDVEYITSESFFGMKWPESPYKSLIVIGGGPIGTEFAHIFASLGGNVSIVQHNVRLLPKEDAELSNTLATTFEDMGISLHLNKDTVKIRKEGSENILTIKDRTTGKITEVKGEAVFIAPGIKSSAPNLHLENTDVELDKRGFIITNEFLETTADNIWAFGDVNGKAPFRHKANYEAEIIANNVFSYPNDISKWRWASYDLIPAVTFTYPQVAHIGLTEAEAKERGYNVQTGHHHYFQTQKGYAMGMRAGDKRKNYVKVVIDRCNNTILGLHAIGPEASILIQPFVNLMNAGNHIISPINEHIEHEKSKEAREKKIERYLDPHKLSTVLETMAPHPALSELPAWIGWYLDN